MKTLTEIRQRYLLTHAEAQAKYEAKAHAAEHLAAQSRADIKSARKVVYEFESLVLKLNQVDVKRDGMTTVKCVIAIGQAADLCLLQEVAEVVKREIIKQLHRELSGKRPVAA